jgi:hypothetical protein
MKPMNIQSIGTILLLLVSAVSVRADAASYAQLLKERDAVLAKIVAHHEGKWAGGLADDEAVFSAQLALFSFRRDSSEVRDEKLRLQEQIVSLHEKRLLGIKARVQSGRSDPVDALYATDSLLAAKQLLAVMHSSEKKG